MKEKCTTKFCQNLRIDHHRKCAKCRQRDYRKKNPEKASYNNLKTHAKMRGKNFTITFEEFLEFCRNGKLLERPGQHLESFSVDRIDHLKGYEPGNLQVLTISENSRKGAFEALSSQGPF